MMELIHMFELRSRWFFATLCLGLLCLVGAVDYLTGFEMSFSVFYLVAVGIAAWFVGKGLGLFMSVLSVAVWTAGDLAAGAHFSRPFIPVWNAAILLVFYSGTVSLVASLRSLHDELESRVQHRTVALTQEIAERERLEKEILEVSEREQRRIGRDLHDSLCQHLTATALAGQVLAEKLHGKGLPEAAHASRIVDLIQEAITIARNLARGIHPVEMEAEGLTAAFQELAQSISRWSKTPCVFDCTSPVLIHDASVANHLYRIAQEAVNNATRHAKAKQVLLSLANSNNGVTLTVEDDGVGLPEGWQKTQGLGTRIMAHRSAMIGASFSIEPNPTGGTLVKCSLDSLSVPQEDRR